MKGFVHHNIIKSTRQVMVMSVLEIVIISAGLSLDVFVAMAYMGAGFSKINKKNLFGLCLLFGGVLLNSRMPRHSCCEVRVMQLHDILLLRTSAILPEAISAGGIDSHH